jgi:hypothetical protein
VKDSAIIFDLAYENFLLSLGQNGEKKKFYRVADFTFCLQFAGETLIDFLTPALAHLEVTPCEADLTLSIWEGNVLFPWKAGAFTFRGHPIEYQSSVIHTSFNEELNVLQMLDKENKRALYCVQDRAKTPWWVGASPFLFIFHWWMKEKGIQLTHGAVVGHVGGSVLLAGKGGSGKSTTALACMKGGMSYVSEDYCLLSSSSQVTAHSLYNSAKVRESTLRFFPELAAYIENEDRPRGEKGFFFHHKFQPEKIVQKAPLKAIVTLKIEEIDQSFLEPINSIEAMASLSATTLWQLPDTGPSVFGRLKKIALSLPCYRLHLGKDFDAIPQLIEKIL